MRAIATGIACLTGRAEVFPEVDYMTRAEVIASFEANRDPLSPEVEVLTKQRLKALSLVGLVPRDAPVWRDLAAFAKNLTGFYDYETKRIVVVDDPETERTLEERFTTLAHEIGHASQDAHWGIEALQDEFATTLERFLAFRSMIEGEATLVSQMLWALAKGWRLESLSWSFDEGKAHAVASSAEEPNSERTALSYFPYAFGTAFMQQVWEAGGMEAMAAQISNPPATVKGVMQGIAHSESADRYAQATLDDVAIPLLPERFKLGGYTHRGPWYLNAMLQHYEPTEGFWNPVVDRVQADVLSWFFDPETKEVVTVWRLIDPLGLLPRALGCDFFGCWVEHSSETASAKVWYVEGDTVVLLATSAADARSLLPTTWRSVKEARAELDAKGYGGWAAHMARH